MLYIIRIVFLNQFTGAKITIFSCSPKFEVMRLEGCDIQSFNALNDAQNLFLC